MSNCLCSIGKAVSCPSHSSPGSSWPSASGACHHSKLHTWCSAWRSLAAPPRRQSGSETSAAGAPGWRRGLTSQDKGGNGRAFLSGGRTGCGRASRCVSLEWGQALDLAISLNPRPHLKAAAPIQTTRSPRICTCCFAVWCPLDGVFASCPHHCAVSHLRHCLDLTRVSGPVAPKKSRGFDPSPHSRSFVLPCLLTFSPGLLLHCCIALKDLAGDPEALLQTDCSSSSGRGERWASSSKAGGWRGGERLKVGFLLKDSTPVSE